MKTTIPFLLAALFALTSFGQTFEGKIVYKNTYKSKMPNVTDEQFTTMMGSTQEYFIKNGDYKSIANGSFFQWLLYVNKDNKLYSKMANSETLLWNDGATNPDEIGKAEVNKAVTEILGYKCDELVLTCKSGIQKYYFNTSLSVDSKQFINHKFGNWYDFLSKSNSLPLKSIIDNGQFTSESVATEVKEMKLDNTLFVLPVDSKTMKSPYGREENLQPTLGFMQVGLDKLTSANCKSGLQFGLDKHRGTFVLNFIIIFLISSGPGRRNTNSQPA